MATLPSREYLLECFDYDQLTDTLTWRKRPRHHFKTKNAWAAFNSRLTGKEIKVKTSIEGISFSRNTITFKIMNGFQSKKHENTKKKGNLHYCNTTNRFHANFPFGDGRKKSRAFKNKEDAENWLKEIRLLFEQNKLPFNIRKHPKAGFYGVTLEYGLYKARVRFEERRHYLGGFKTAKEASNAYQIAKQQIVDGVFVAPVLKIPASGYKAVRANKNGTFTAKYKGAYIGKFNAAEEAHAAYLKAKNHKTFDDGLDILAKLAKEFG